MFILFVCLSGLCMYKAARANAQAINHWSKRLHSQFFFDAVAAIRRTPGAAETVRQTTAHYHAHLLCLQNRMLSSKPQAIPTVLLCSEELEAMCWPQSYTTTKL